MLIRRTKIICALLLVTSTALAKRVPPASLNIELSNDTLALASPLCIKASLENMTDGDLIVDCGDMFGLGETWNLSITIVDLKSEEWRYYGSGIVSDYLGCPEFYFLLPAFEKVTDGFLLRLDHIAPVKYRGAYENLPPGTYQLYLSYNLQGLDEPLKIYSDTLDFVYLPAVENHLPVILYLDSLSTPSGEMNRMAILKRITDSGTPYSEAAWYMSLLSIYDLDSFRVEKKRFDTIYPEAYLASSLLNHQYPLIQNDSISEERDSIAGMWKKLDPYCVDHIRYGLREGSEPLCIDDAIRKKKQSTGELLKYMNRASKDPCRK